MASEDATHRVEKNLSVLLNALSRQDISYGYAGDVDPESVTFIWQLLRLSGQRAHFISTVQYSLGGDAQDIPEHQIEQR